MKKLLVVLLCAALLSALLSGCNSLPPDGGDTSYPVESPAGAMPDSTPLPSSERLENSEKIVTGTYEDVKGITVSIESEEITLNKTSSEALFDLLLGADTITVPNPFHYECYFNDSIYTITISYSDGSADVIRNGGEAGGEAEEQIFLRTLPDTGKQGDLGYVYLVDEDNELLNFILGL